MKFSTPKAAKIVGLSKRCFLDWAALGLILADIQSAAGSGTRREFSYSGVLRAYLAVYFQDKYGFKRNKLKKLMDDLWRDGVFYKWAYGTYLMRRDFQEKSEEELEKLKKKGVNGCLIIFNPYEEDNKADFYEVPLAEALKNPDISKKIEGINDMIGVNLAELKRDIDHKIAQLE